MYHLWKLKLKKCSYDTLVFEFTNFFETNDTRPIERYLGRPEKTIHSSGSAQTTRMNRISGKTALFEYHNIRRVPAKKGLMETLGYITLKPEEIMVETDMVTIPKKTKNWIAILHHERMSYCTEQTNLEAAYPLQENESFEDSSKENMCVSSLPQGKECEKTVLEVVSPTSDVETKERIKEKKEVIDSTHTYRSSESERQEANLSSSFTVRDAWSKNLFSSIFVGKARSF